ncbi:hypothetical protein ACJ5NV_16705 [Loktanella agnita]|uniref:hypothetical protein n=1 Tax=Loktanella agnita TaxID=287097 RepID=UPI0039894751
MNIRWLLRAKHWAQNPPSVSRMKFVCGIIALCILLVVIEKLFGWPEALTVSRTRLR